MSSGTQRAEGDRLIRLGVRLVQKVSSTRAFAQVAPHFVPSLDRTVHRLTRGKTMLISLVLPGLVLTTRGARSGLSRRTPLAFMAENRTMEEGVGAGTEGAGTCVSWILAGSNFGRANHPAWTSNLIAHPDAEISWKGESIPVSARLLHGEEREAVWQALTEFWPPYATYQARVDREVRLFRLVRR